VYKPKNRAFVMLDLSMDVDTGTTNPRLSLSVKDVYTKAVYKKSSLIPTSSPIKVPKSPGTSPDKFTSQASVPISASVSSIQATLGSSSLGPFKTKSQKQDERGILKFDDSITLKLQPSLSQKYDWKDKCLTVTLWEKKGKMVSPENVGVLFLAVDQIPSSRDDAGDTWLAIQPPPPV